MKYLTTEQHMDPKDRDEVRNYLLYIKYVKFDVIVCLNDICRMVKLHFIYQLRKVILK